ncbi:MAG: glycosyltransferase family 4 protein [candidate division Zixibacteria bacterium]|nr:glycosyltransferase family 4 protein [candidate division Zixibacteria bacterium]MDH3937376.1 glycosyltransferase family 4 protein [candidate division Zixibacteria bacterium]
MKRNNTKPNLLLSSLALGGPVDHGTKSDDSPQVLLVTNKRPRSAVRAVRFSLLEGLLDDQNRLHKIDHSADSSARHRRGAGALDLRRFVRTVPSCEIVHCNLAEPEAWTMLAVGQTLVARFFGKAVVADLGFSIDEESFEHPPLALRLILGLCTVAVVTSEHAATILARRGVHVEQIPEALAPSEFTDRKVNSVQPQVLTVYSQADRSATECVVRAFNSVKAKYPRAEMTVLADDSDGDAARQLTGDGARSSITVAAALTAEQTSSYYAEADMFVNSSVVGGLRPMKKAMASGLPVVSAAGFYRDELIVDRRNGLTYRENDPGALADRIIELVETPRLIGELTENARLSVADHTWSRIGRRWSSCYRRLRTTRRTATAAAAGHHSHQQT